MPRAAGSLLKSCPAARGSHQRLAGFCIDAVAMMIGIASALALAGGMVHLHAVCAAPPPPCCSLERGPEARPRRLIAMPAGCWPPARLRPHCAPGPDLTIVITKSLRTALGLEKAATELDIKKAYRREALRWHPKQPGRGHREVQ